MTRSGMLAALGVLACAEGCGGKGGETDNTPYNSTSAGAGGVSTGGIGTGGVGTGGVGASTSGTSNGVSLGGMLAIAGTTSRSSSALTTGGSVATAASTASTGGSVTASVGQSGIAGETGVQHVGGAAGTNGAGGTGACNYPACLYNLYSACPAAPPTTTCIIQDTTSPTQRQTNACYGDGSSASSVTDLTTSTSTMTLKRDGTTCYTLETSVTTPDLVPTSVSMTLKNGSGTLIATQVFDVPSQTTTVTCAGEQPVILNAACDTSSSGTYDCQPGVCNP